MASNQQSKVVAISNKRVINTKFSLISVTFDNAPLQMFQADFLSKIG